MANEFKVKNGIKFPDDSIQTAAVTNLNSLTDVVITSATNGQVLSYNGTNWVNATGGGGGGSGTVTSVATGTGLTGGPITTTGTISLTGQALAVHNVATSGFFVRTGTDTVVARSISGDSATGTSVTNGDGISAAPTINLTGQALALHQLATSGVIARTGSGTVAARTITAGPGIAITNGDGVSGNPTITARSTVLSQTSQSSFGPNISLYDMYALTAQNTTLTITDPSGSPQDGQRLTFRIKDNGTSRTIQWNGIYTPIGVTLPTATTPGKTTYVGCIYNSSETRWDVIAVATQG
jgi:hypothetical protein